MCDRRGKNKATATIFFVGVMFGAMAFGSLSDRYQRFPVFQLLKKTKQRLRLSDFSIGMAEGSCCWYHTCLGWCLLLQAPFLLPTWCSWSWGSLLASASQASSSFQQSSVIISFHHLNIHCIRSYISFTSEATEEKIYNTISMPCWLLWASFKCNRKKNLKSIFFF